MRAIEAMAFPSLFKKSSVFLRNWEKEDKDFALQRIWRNVDNDLDILMSSLSVSHTQHTHSIFVTNLTMNIYI